ncbi:MAG: cytochrome C biogenesis protein, partial [Gluconacetobacter diazotrophicus]|nr:cytochrome C biogenesis protein [Gluconacetobacter diazotrophicus]
MSKSAPFSWSGGRPPLFARPGPARPRRAIPVLAALLVGSLAASFGGAPRPAGAAESAAVRTDHDTATLVSDADNFAPDRPVGLGLRLRLAPGWHTYWSNPGDAGEPATVQVSATGGGTGQTAVIEWPVPERLPEGPLMSFAYTGDVLLPMRLVPVAGASPDAPMTVKATADWLACSNVCVPEHGEFTLSLPRGEAKPSAEAPLFAAARAKLPTPSPFTARIASDGTFTLAGDGLSPRTVASAIVFPAATGVIDQAAPQQASVTSGLVTVPLKPVPSGFKPDAPFDAVVVLRDPTGADRALTVQAAPGGPGATAVSALPSAVALPLPATTGAGGSAPGFGALLLSAFLGGIILNLMPCVFPVLAMKALSLARLSGLERRDQRLSALFYTLGILLAFAVLGGLILALREAGRTVGWGIQFQSPIFVAATCWVLFTVGLNLLGVFEVGGRLAGAGQSFASRGG